jgi:hypothetical protein
MILLQVHRCSCPWLIIQSATANRRDWIHWGSTYPRLRREFRPCSGSVELKQSIRNEAVGIGPRHVRVRALTLHQSLQDGWILRPYEPLIDLGLGIGSRVSEGFGKRPAVKTGGTMPGQNVNGGGDGRQ